MSWYKKAQEEIQDEVQNITNPTEADEPQAANIEELIGKDPQIKELTVWFTKLKEANEFIPQAKELLEKKLEGLGVSEGNLPPEIKAIFSEE